MLKATCSFILLLLILSASQTFAATGYWYDSFVNNDIKYSVLRYSKQLIPPADIPVGAVITRISYTWYLGAIPADYNARVHLGYTRETDWVDISEPQATQAIGIYGQGVLDHQFDGRDAKKTMYLWFKLDGPSTTFNPAIQGRQSQIRVSWSGGEISKTNITTDNNQLSFDETANLNGFAVGATSYNWTTANNNCSFVGQTTESNVVIKSNSTENVLCSITREACDGPLECVTDSITIVNSATSNQAPVAIINQSKTEGNAALDITFNGNESFDPENGSLTYSWNFGDDSSNVQGVMVNHTYKLPGKYTATLKVTDNAGLTSSSTTVITVIDGDPEFKLEVGELQLTDKWIRVTTSEYFNNPIVIAGPVSRNEDEPCVVRLRNIDKSGFDIRLQEWDYLDGKHAPEIVSYMVLEQGHFKLKDGTQVEAGKFNSSAYEYEIFNPVSFEKGFSNTPIVMSSIATFKDSATVTGRMKNIDSKGFQFKVQEQELFVNGHASEVVHYVAWEAGKVNLGNISVVVGKTRDRVRGKRPFAIPYNGTLPMFFGNMQGQDGWNPAAVRYDIKTANQCNVIVQEEKSNDLEVRHTTEVVGYFFINES